MRRILIMFLIVILLAGLVLITTQGVVLGSITIPSIKSVISNNENLETQIANLRSIIDGEYKQTQMLLKAQEESLQKAKQSYQDKITYSTEEELKDANNVEKYEIGYLWTKLGVYAKKNKLELQADLLPTETTLQDKDDKEKTDLALLCDLNVTIQGEYLPISEFVYAIENDEDLGFRIREFSLVPYSETELQGKFKITSIGINKNTLNSSPNVTNQTSNTEQTINDETTNNADTSTGADNTVDNSNNNQ